MGMKVMPGRAYTSEQLAHCLDVLADVIEEVQRDYGQNLSGPL